MTAALASDAPPTNAQADPCSAEAELPSEPAARVSGFDEGAETHGVPGG